MANRKPKVLIPPPSTGIRKDINPLMRDVTMASEGDNCLYFDKTIRPRPCLTKEVNDPTSGEQVFNQYQELYNLKSQAGAIQHTISSACATDDGYIIAAISTQTLDLSIDNGMTWTQDALAHPGSAYIGHIEEKNGYLFAFLQDKTVYRAPVSTLPSSLAWTLVTTMTSSLIPLDSSGYSFIYDEDNDSWVIMASILNNIYISVIYDASGSATTDDLTVPNSEYQGTNLHDFGFDWVNEKYIVVSAYEVDIFVNYTSTFFHSFQFEWSGSAYSIGTTLTDYVEISHSTNNVPTPGEQFILGGAVMNAKQANLFVFTLLSHSNAGQSYIGEMELDNDGLFIISSISYRTIDSSWHEVIDVARGADRIAFMDRLETSDHVLPSYTISNTDISQWMQFFDNRIMTEEILLNMFANSSFNQMLIMYIDGSGEGVEDYGILLSLPSSPDGFLIGNATTVFQADLSDEDNVIIIGATHGLARLNRSTGDWDRITANDDETIDHAPTGVWVDEDTTFDIPPLSAYPDDTSYVDGVSINGVYGSNPWVFRTFEAQGETFLIGTNGQCYPVCYHPDMPGGFARRLGEMTEDDPNYDATPLAGSALGDLAPKARCIASAANRVLLANDPSGSKFSVSASAANDHDRAWGDAQEVLLGDTPGSIVTMNEISALQVAIYKEDAIYHAIAQTEFLGVSAPFRFELSKAGISGPCSPASVVRNHDGRQIYFARDGGVYLYDGVAPIDLGPNIRSMIQGDINLNSLGKCWGVADTKRKLIWFFYPSSDELVNKGIVISTDQGVPYPVWPITLPLGWEFTTGIDAILSTDTVVGDLGILGSYSDEATLDSFSSGRRAMLMGLKTGIFFSHEYEERSEQYTDDGVPISIHLQGGWLTPGGTEQYTADTIHHIFSCNDLSQELEVRLRAQQLGRNIRVSKPSPLSSGKLQRRTRHRVSGSQFSVDIQGKISRIFNWGGGMLSLSRRGGR